jgi:hypothetical protein
MWYTETYLIPGHRYSDGVDILEAVFDSTIINALETICKANMLAIAELRQEAARMD